MTEQPATVHMDDVMAALRGLGLAVGGDTVSVTFDYERVVVVENRRNEQGFKIPLGNEAAVTVTHIPIRRGRP